MKMNLTQYLRNTYGVHLTTADFTRLANPLYNKLKLGSDKEILLQGLIGLVFGSYILHDTKLMKLADETIKKYSPFL